MSEPKTKKSDYRPNVGVVVFNDKGEVFLGRRRGERGFWVWQFPQGGMDKGESPKQAALRELYEETGIDKSKLKILGQTNGWLYYDFPNGPRKGWRGQRQKWFAVRFTGKAKHINLKIESPPEFSSYAWGTLDDACHLIVPFKRKVYKYIAREFKAFAKVTK